MLTASPRLAAAFAPRFGRPRLFLLAAASLALSWTGGCLDAAGPGAPDAPPPAGMVRIAAKGKSFTQGSRGTLASRDELPAMADTFSYDYALDETEATQGAFLSLMGRDPVPAGSAFGKSPRHPVYNVTWYDAVLYCNARSKADRRDTVYAYDGVESSPDGSVRSLRGLAAHLEREGYRLPTESEWEFAAYAGSDAAYPWGALADSSTAGAYAWYAENSGDAAHPVASLRPNAFGAYDMAGNVMEWVNDWKGVYPAGGARDFAGARDPGDGFEIPVKGGSFDYGWKQLRPANRAATYPAVPSAATQYVGFRCALGAIPRPGFSTADGNPIATDPVTLEIPKPSSYVGAARLAFVNFAGDRGHLAYVDFAQSPPRVREFMEPVNARHPSFSPDGNWIAFCTAAEGRAEGSQIRVRGLGPADGGSRFVAEGFIPRWWVDPASRDTFLVYTNSAVQNQDARWSSTRTLTIKMSGGAPVGAPSVLSSDGGFHDGRSRDGRYLATGFTRLKLRDLRKRTTRVLFTAPSNGKAAGDTSQVCNVSVAPDSTARTMFLDFGAQSSRLTGSPYGVHEVAFIADKSGKVLKWFRAPSGENGWEDLEWSNRPRYAVSGAADAGGNRRHLYLVDLSDFSSARIATGTNLLDPALWLGDAEPASDTLDADSLGHYNDPVGNESRSRFSDKMVKFWNGHADWEVVALGSSHVEDGVDPSVFKKLRGFNLGIPATGFSVARRLALDYVFNHCPKLKVLVVEVVPGFLDRPDGAFNQDTAILQSTGVVYDRSHGFWTQGLPPRFVERVRMAPNSSLSFLDSLGHAPAADTGWGTPPLLHSLRNDWTPDDSIYRGNLALIDSFAREVAARRVHLVLVNLPESPLYKDDSYYQKFGPGWETAKTIMSDMKALESISPFVHFYDADDFGNHDYAGKEFLNEDHLNSAGARKFTARLDSLIAGFP